MVGTPALVVDDCGFTHTITDGYNGRRLPWPDTEQGLSQWVEAVEQAGLKSNREESHSGLMSVDEAPKELSGEKVREYADQLGIKEKNDEEKDSSTE